MIKLIKYTIIFSLLVTETHINLVHGQDKGNDSLTYYLEIAVMNNPVILQRFAEYQAALQKVPQSGSLPDPELSTGVLLMPMELIGGKQVADFRLMQMFPWFGTLKSAKNEMSLMAKAKYESFRDAELQILYDVQRTWYNLYKTEQEIRISERNIEILKTIERLALVRFRTSNTGGNGSSSMESENIEQLQASYSGSAGMQGMSGSITTQMNRGSGNSFSMQGNSMTSSSGSSTLADIYRIQIETGELENRIALLNNQKKTVRAEFNSYLDRNPDSEVTVADSLTPDTLNILLSAIQDSIINNNPILSMIRFEEQSLDARKKMVTRMGFPMFGLGIDYSLINKSEMSTSEMNGRDMIMPMVSVTLPIYRRKYKAMQSETELLKTSATHEYSATTNNLQTEYYQAVQLYQDAMRRIKLYADQYLLASKSLDIIIKSYSASGASLTDVLRIQQQTLDYELKQVEAVTDFNTAIAWLKRLSVI
jgi:outer membrane protein TolC